MGNLEITIEDKRGSEVQNKMKQHSTFQQGRMHCVPQVRVHRQFDRGVCV